MGRRPIGRRAMTAAERQRRHRGKPLFRDKIVGPDIERRGEAEMLAVLNRWQAMPDDEEALRYLARAGFGIAVRGKSRVRLTWEMCKLAPGLVEDCYRIDAKKFLALFDDDGNLRK